VSTGVSSATDASISCPLVGGDRGTVCSVDAAMMSPPPEVASTSGSVAAREVTASVAARSPPPSCRCLTTAVALPA
jgi:hypothetical protein